MSTRLLFVVKKRTVIHTPRLDLQFYTHSFAQSGLPFIYRFLHYHVIILPGLRKTRFIWWQSRVMLQSLTLGSTPPMFSFIRALEVPEDGDHVVSVLFGLTFIP